MTQEKKTLIVEDSSCTALSPIREHFIRYNNERIPITFQHGKPTVVPYEIGLKFLKKKGFNVKENEGGIPMELPPVTPENIAQGLKPGEVIAKLDELNDDALKLRVYQKLNGEQFLKVSGGREDNIKFLLGGGKEGVELDYSGEEVEEVDLDEPEQPAQVPDVSQQTPENTGTEPDLESQTTGETPETDSEQSLEGESQEPENVQVLINSDEVDETPQIDEADSNPDAPSIADEAEEQAEDAKNTEV